MSPPGTSGGRPVACDYCKNKKIRCSGDSPCENCHSKGVGCRYPPVRHPKDRRRRSSPPESTRELDKRLAQLEELLKASHQSPGGRVPIFIGGQSPASGQTQQPSNYERDCDASLVDWMLDLEPTSFTPSKFAPDYSVQDGIASEEAHVNEEGRTYDMNPSYSHSLDYMQFNTASFVAQPSHSGAPPSRSRHTSGSPGSGNDTSPPMHLKGIRRNSIMSPTETNETYRPGSLLSICSNPGIGFVAQITGSAEFGESARTLSTGRTGAKSKRSFTRTAEPNEEDAWKYCNAYFENTLERVFGIVHRSTFEERLRTHIANPSQSEDDAGWYALRMAVFASGCRAEYSKPQYKMSFEEAQRRGWCFFEAGLAVQTDLLYGETDISAVQALVAMCFFTEGLGNPTLEYALCCNALLLAQAKGLHRSESDVNPATGHSWLFWAIYCYATHLSCLSGRAPVIDDELITCPLPTGAAEGSTINIEFFTYIINLCRISSATFKQLAAIKTLSIISPREVAEIINKLHWRLQEWRDGLPACIRPDNPIDASLLPEGYHIYHIMFLHFSYYGSMMAIHSVFAYPWNFSMMNPGYDPSIYDQAAASQEIVIAAARNIILATKYIDIEASSPGWLLVYYPLVGCMNAFIHVLNHPTFPTVQSDLSLMEMVVGHFGHLGFVSSSEASFSFPRLMVTLASAAVKRAQADATTRSLAPMNMGDYMDPMFFNEAESVVLV